MSKNKTTKPTKAKRDALGSRIGTQANKINETLLRARSPLTLEVVAERSGVALTRVRNHTRWLRQYEAAELNKEGEITLTQRETPVFGVHRKRRAPDGITQPRLKAERKARYASSRAVRRGKRAAAKKATEAEEELI